MRLTGGDASKSNHCASSTTIQLSLLISVATPPFAENVPVPGTVRMRTPASFTSTIGVAAAGNPDSRRRAVRTAISRRWRICRMVLFVSLLGR